MVGGVKAGAAPLERLRIERPTFLVDRERVAGNIQRMVDRAAAADVDLRPHFKTHRSRDIGRWFRDFGVSSITVSSVEMARYFVGDGWNDITVAFPVNPREISYVAELSEHARLSVLVDSVASVELVAGIRAAGLRAWVKVDTGYRRAGIDWEDDEELLAVGRAAHRAGLELAGVLTHNGLVYRERGRDAVRRVHREGVERARLARDLLSAAGLGDLAVSIGDTPGIGSGGPLDGVDEIRPGNFVFNDLTQVAIGSCTSDEVAVAVACPVVSVYSRRGEAVLYGGSVHLGSESLEQDGATAYGRVCPNWPVEADPGAPVVRLSQEHGVVRLEGEGARPMEPGDLACVLPVHSCITGYLHSRYLTLDGEWLDTMRA